ncbi:MAG TPA: hypothetical protein VFC78_17770 [Tepidisphaeraceae bacterium]|nr:hypothetical protein [Tepidisphaeraceae bacterium]
MAAIAVLSVPCRSFAAEGMSLPRDIEEALRENAAGLDPITVSWQYTFHVYLHGDVLQEERHDELTWSGGKFYNSQTCIRPAQYGQSEFSFDGKLFCAGGQDKVIFSKELIDAASKRPLNQLAIVLDYCDDICLLVPTTRAEMLKDRAIHRILKSLASGAVLAGIDRTRVGNRDLVRLRLNVANAIRDSATRADLAKVERSVRQWPREATREQDVKSVLSAIRQERQMPERLIDSYYLDPALHYAVTQWEQSYPDGTPLYRCENTNFEQVAGRRLWLPRSCIVSQFWCGSPPEGFKLSVTPLFKRELSVTSISPTPDAKANFTLNYTKPGTFVVDNTDPHVTKRYQLPTALENLAGGPRFSLARTLFLWANALAGACLAGYLIWKRFKRTNKLQ